MSLINEAINNLKDNKGQQTRGAVAKEPKEGRSALFSLLSLLSVLTILFVVSFKYFNATKYYLSTKSFIENSMSWTSSLGNNNKLLPDTVQMQYYEAIDALNEGHATYAVGQLKTIINNYPKFSPAKQTYDNLIQN